MAKLQDIFKYEQSYIEIGFNPDEIRKRRQEDQREKLEHFFSTLEGYEGEYTSQSKIGKAIAYALNQKSYLSEYLNDGKAEISNN